jgi:hypothetical protein
MNPVQPITSGNGAAVKLADILAQQEKAREIPVRINLKDYVLAVDTLIKLAQIHCGGSKCAAQILLGLYNGRAWHVNLIDLCNLDPDNYRAAMIAIRGRIELNIEPHEIIENGDAVFDQLQEEWKHLHTKNRYKNF